MGFSSVFSLASLLGFALLLAGIGLAVLASSQGRNWRRGAALAAVGLVIGVVFSVISQGVLLVEAQQVAVVFNTVNGSLDDNPRGPGTHIIVPVFQQATIYQTQQRTLELSAGSTQGSGRESISARTTDGQEVDLDVSILYGVDPANVNIVHQRWRDNYENGLVLPTVRSLVRDVVARFRANEIYGTRRSELEQGMQDTLGPRLAEEGLLLTDLLVRDIDFSDAFTNAIEQAQIAEQESERARLRVQQIQQEAEQARAQAEGQRDAAIARAEGEAQSIILRAQAEAEALRLVSEQIAANPALIQYQYVQRLSENVNIALVPSNSPFLFDIEGLVPNADFVAPDVPAPSEIIPDTTPTPGN